jgi:hypothetical protein
VTVVKGQVQEYADGRRAHAASGSGTRWRRDGRELRAALEARLGDCWERLEDAVSELHAVHDVGLTAIVERISALVAREHGT